MAPENEKPAALGDTSVSRGVPFQFEDIRTLAAKILRNANTNAQQMLDTARKESKGIQQKAFEEGMAQGKEAGFQAGRTEGLKAGQEEGRKEIIAQSAGLTDTVGVFLDALQNERIALANTAEADLLRLAMEIAKKIVRREFHFDPDLVLETVSAAIELTIARTDITLFVNPADLARVEEFLPSIHRKFADVERIRVEPDPSVEPGGTRTVTREGEVDLQLGEQLAALERALLGVVESEEAGAGPSP